MAQWYIARAGQPLGPYTGEQLLALIGAERIGASDFVWREGLASWIDVDAAASELRAATLIAPIIPNAPSRASPNVRPPPILQRVADGVADIVGVERLEGFNLKELLSASFRRYRTDEIERHFSTGNSETTPSLAAIEPGWPKPWMFVRLLVGTAAVFFGFLLVLATFPNPKLLPGLIVVGSFAVPLAMLVFFFELNSPRNVSLYLVLRYAIVGGLVSIAFALLFFSSVAKLRWLGPPLAGPVEELGKLLTVYVLSTRLDPERYPYLLNGMLFGAAVGAGFAAFESAGYAFEIMLSGVAAGEGIDAIGGSVNIIVRGILAPFGHIVWTALVAGALWRVKLDQKLTPKMLVHPRVLKLLGVAMILHALWNMSFLHLPFFLRQWLLGFVAWIIAFSMMQSGLKQIKAAQMAEAEGQAGLSGATVVFRRAGPVAMRRNPT